MATATATATRKAPASPSATTKLASGVNTKAMLVRPTVRKWNIERNDKALAAEVMAKHGADKEMGKFGRFLVDPRRLEPIRKIADRIRDETYKRTLPWIDGGTRVLSSTGYFDYVNVMRGLTAEFDAAVADFVANYPQYRAEAKVALNGLFRAHEYPTDREIASKFEAVYRIYPFPDSADFRVSMSESEAAAVREEIERGVRAALDEGMRDVWARMQETVGRMAERLSSYNNSGDKVQGVFRDSLVQNVRDLVDLLPSLNVVGDPAVDAFAKQIQQRLCAFSPEELRTSAEAREQTGRAAQEIHDRMSAFV